MQQHYVKFYSPGTLVAEITAEPIDSWDIDKAVEMSKQIVERHGATPYAFKFTTRAREDNELDSKQVAESGYYFLGGQVKTLAEVEAEEPGSILASNMRGNGWDKVVTTNNSYKWTQPLEPGDVVLEVSYKEGR